MVGVGHRHVMLPMERPTDNLLPITSLFPPCFETVFFNVFFLCIISLADSPVSSFHLTIEVLVLQMPAATSFSVSS